MRKVSNWCLLCVTSAFESKFSEKTFIDKSCDLELCINYIREKTKKSDTDGTQCDAIP